jgi:catechol 2,3-dioxygenase-like lactoylglutathione lyase family enzyme
MTRLGAAAVLIVGLLEPAVAEVRAVESVAITVGELDRALAFYTEVLPFEPVGEVVEVDGPAVERLYGVFGLRLRQQELRLGEETIELIEVMTPKGRRIPEASRSHDHWFQHIAIVVRDIDAAYAHLREHDVEHASTGPQVLPDWNPAAGGIAAFYFKDPDGNHLEIISFPAGKGDPRWQAPGDDLFLGIDHTAIVVEDTEAALGFWRDALGLEVVGGSENYGPEQERLNNVFGARLRITALRADQGIGVEFLEYLAPGTGRPMPVDTTASDLWHWHIEMASDDVSADAERIMMSSGALVSPGVIARAPEPLGFEQALMARGPTGHAVLIHDQD